MRIYRKNMTINVFLDTNIIMDLFDKNRKSHETSFNLIKELLGNESTLYINSDTLTTTFYLLRSQKKVSFKEALYAIRETTNICELISIEVEDVHKTLFLCENKNNKFNDYEDTLQYVCAKKVKADLIITNDKGFISLDIPIQTTK